MNHVDHAAHQVAVAVGQVAVVALHQCIEAEAAILPEGNLPQQEVPQSIRPQNLLHRLGPHNVAPRLRHLALVEEQPAVGLHRPRHGNPRRHQKRRPIDAVEAADLLADQVQIRGPELFKARLIRRIVRPITQRCNVVGQSVQPHINHMLFVARNGDAPGKTCPAHR